MPTKNTTNDMLYIVGTPIGNLKDITYRAVEILKSVDYIACEDTRTSKVLLDAYDIHRPLVSHHKFNEKSSVGGIVSDLKNGKNIALISDAGMPGISDPGTILVRECIANDVEYTVVPGACAATTAFILSGMDTPFTFIGFLPKKTGECKSLVENYKNYSGSLIFYVTQHSIDDDIKNLFSVFGDRKICIVRELTKKFESIYFSTLEKGYDAPLKGEFVLVVEGKDQNENALNDLTIEEHFEYYTNLGLDKNQAIKNVAHDRKVKKDVVYKIVNK